MNKYTELRPIISNTPQIINYNDRNMINSRDKDINIVQKDMHLNYYLSNFETLNNKINDHKFYELNPINTRYNNYNTFRKKDINEFKYYQGGYTNNNFLNMPINTRKEKIEIKSDSYIPNSKNMPLPSNQF